MPSMRLFVSMTLTFRVLVRLKSPPVRRSPRLIPATFYPATPERLAYRVASIWCALLLAIFLLYNSGVQGVMNANATSLAMMTLLALGTFVAGVQARVWQICAVGGLLFLAVPGVGWLDQSPLLLAAATLLIIALGGLVWWVRQRRQDATTSHLASGTPSR
jgi:hypothetical protein